MAAGGQAEPGWKQKQEVEHRAEPGGAGGCGVDRGVDGASLWLGRIRWGQAAPPASGGTPALGLPAGPRAPALRVQARGWVSTKVPGQHWGEIFSPRGHFLENPGWDTELQRRARGGRHGEGSIAQSPTPNTPQRTSSLFRKRRSLQWDSGLGDGGQRSISQKGLTAVNQGFPRSCLGQGFRDGGDHPIMMSKTQARSKPRTACPWEGAQRHRVGENNARPPCCPQLHGHTCYWGIYITQLDL